MPNAKVQYPLTPAEPSVIMSISPHDADHWTLQEFLEPDRKVVRASTLSSGLRLLRERSFATVVCSDEARPGSWRDVVQMLVDHPAPPNLIVTSRLADESMWAEALNLGAFDMLVKPFDLNEVRRVIAAACDLWSRRRPVARITVLKVQQTA